MNRRSTLLIGRGPITGEVRCSGCDRLLGEEVTAPYRFTCGRCKAVTRSGIVRDNTSALVPHIPSAPSVTSVSQ